MRARDDVHRHELADAPRRRGAGVGRGFHGRDVAAHDRGHVAGADLLPADQRDLGGLHHRVGRLDHRDQALGFDHPERLTHCCLLTNRLQLLTADRASVDGHRNPQPHALPQAADRVFDERGKFAVC